MKLSRESKDYNDTVSSFIASICLKAYANLDKEIENNPHLDKRMLMARAIGDAIEDHVKVLSVDNFIDIEILSRVEGEYLKHIEKATFMKFTEDLFKTNCFRSDSLRLPYEYKIQYQLAVLDFSKLEK